MVEVVKNFNRFYFEEFRPSKYCVSLIRDTKNLQRAAENLESIEHIRTVFDDERPIAVFGFIPHSETRGEVFAFIEEGVGVRLINIFRAIKKEAKLMLLNVNRLESYISADDKYLHRWMRSLGFTLECARMSQRGDSGEDQSLYVLVRGA